MDSFTSTFTNGILGYATLPWNYTSAPKDDGVGKSDSLIPLASNIDTSNAFIVFLYSSLPGGTSANFSGGQTLTHEVGHWVGLYHPFQGGCTGPGDFVDDTPPEALPGSGCPIGRDTCPGGGVDPIRKSSTPRFVPNQKPMSKPL